MFVTYAQNYEDLFLERCFANLETGRWVDVGAWVPEIDSVTKALSLRGWTGINIEPIPQYFDQLVSRRPNDINLRCAIGRHPGTITMNHIPETGLSTVHAHFAAEAEERSGVTADNIEVEVRTLNSVCEQYLNDGDLHFVKIDVEGSEGEVLASFDLHRFRPWLLIIESNLPNSTEQSYAHWQPQVLDANYELVFYDGLNRWYAAKEHLELRRHFEFPLYLFRTVMPSSTQDSIQQLEASLAETRAQIDDIRSSRSWKITAPVRRLSNRLLGHRNSPQG